MMKSMVRSVFGTCLTIGTVASISLAPTTLWSKPPVQEYDFSVVDFADGDVAPLVPEIEIIEMDDTLPSRNIADGGYYDFGTVQVGTLRAVNFMIRNVGSANLTIDVSDFSNFVPTSQGFTITQLPNQSVIVPGGQILFQVTYAPPINGGNAVNFAFHSNDLNESPFHIQFWGYGTGGVPEIEVVEQDATAPDTVVTDGGTYNFGNVLVGTSRTVNFRIRNIGTAGLILDLSDFWFSTSYSNAFAVSGNPSASYLAPGAETHFQITFFPPTNGPRNAPFAFNTNDADENPFNITFSGTGYGGVPEIEVLENDSTAPDYLITDGANYGFGSVMIGTSKTVNFRIRNVGSGPLTIDLADFSNPFPVGQGYSIHLNPIIGGGSTLLPGSEVHFQVTFTPVTAGLSYVILSFNNNDSNENPYDIAFYGTGY